MVVGFNQYRTFRFLKVLFNNQKSKIVMAQVEQHQFIEIRRKISKSKTEKIQKEIAAGSYTESELKVAKEILADRGIVVEEKPTSKKSGKKAEAPKEATPKKAAAPKKDDKVAEVEKESAEGEKEAPKKKEAAPKKKSEKIGLTKSDKIRTMLLEGKTTKDIIKAFEDEQITVRYPEIRRNRIWLKEKENWIDPNVKVTGEDEEVENTSEADEALKEVDSEEVKSE